MVIVSTGTALLDFAKPKHSVDEIITTLSNLFRYQGKTRYNVAAHSCLVHDLVSAHGVEDYVAFFALLHDIPESVTGDVNGPFKHFFGIKPTKNLEIYDMFMKSFFTVFEFSHTLSEEEHAFVKSADFLSSFYEMKHCLNPTQEILHTMLESYGKENLSKFPLPSQRYFRWTPADSVTEFENRLRLYRPHLVKPVPQKAP